MKKILKEHKDDFLKKFFWETFKESLQYLLEQPLKKCEIIIRKTVKKNFLKEISE